MSMSFPPGARLSLLQLRAIAAIHSGRVALDVMPGAFSLIGYGARVHIAFDDNRTVDAYLVGVWVGHTTAASAGRAWTQKDIRSP